MTRVVDRLKDEGILAMSPSRDTVRVVDPYRYMTWLERSYRVHGQANLDPRMQDAIRSYVGRGQPLGAFATDPLTGARSFAGALPGTHAEVLALNDLLAGGRASDLAHVATVRAQNGAHFVACAQCTGIINQLPPEIRTIVWTGKVTAVEP